MLTFTVDVTEEDIAIGERRNCLFCPVARALRRVPEIVSVVSAYPYAVAFHTENRYHCFAPPTPVGEFIRDYDRGDPVKPFSFTLTIPK